MIGLMGCEKASLFVAPAPDSGLPVVAMVAGVIDKMPVTPMAAAKMTVDRVRHVHMRVVGGLPDFGSCLMARPVIGRRRRRRRRWHGDCGTGGETERESQQTGADTGIHL